MIKTSLGNTKIEGSVSTILTDYVMITKAVYEVLEERVNSKFAKEQLENAFKDAFKSPEEIEKELKEKIGKDESLKDLVKGLLKDLMEEDDNE